MMEILIAKPRGFCAGVDRALRIVEHALKHLGPPIYVRHAIVHNEHVVEDLKRRGVVFAEDLTSIPRGAWVTLSAHGVSPAVKTEAALRDLRVIDATCPLVTKVHDEVRRFAREGYSVLLVGHRDHVEVIGTSGEAPAVIVVETVEEVRTLRLPNPERVAVTTQTTLSLDEAREIIAAIKARFPQAVLPRVDDICYATQNRQDATKLLAQQVDCILVLGSPTSSNSNRLREVGEKAGCRSYLVAKADDINPRWFDEVSRLGISAGASTPESFVAEVLEYLKLLLGEVTIRELEAFDERMTFSLPRELTSITESSHSRSQ